MSDKEEQETRLFDIDLENKDKDILQNTVLKETQIISLEDAINRLHIEADFTSKALSGNLNEAKESIKDVINNVNDALAKYKEGASNLETNNNKLENLISLLAILPNKIEDKAEEISVEIRLYLNSFTSLLKNELLELQGRQLNELKTHFLNFIENLKLEAATISTNKELMLKKYNQEMLESTKVISKGKLRNFLGMLLLAICSSGILSYFINSYFPHSVQISKTGNVLIKDSKVLVTGNDIKK